MFLEENFWEVCFSRLVVQENVMAVNSVVMSLCRILLPKIFLVLPEFYDMKERKMIQIWNDFYMVIFKNCFGDFSGLFEPCNYRGFKMPCLKDLDIMDILKFIVGRRRFLKTLLFLVDWWRTWRQILQRISNFRCQTFW